MCHSWTGNLITNACWQDFWLNEGFTVFLEMKVLEIVHGKEYSEVHWHERLSNLKSTVRDHPNQALIPAQDINRNPDYDFSLIPYVKGCSLLK